MTYNWQSRNEPDRPRIVFRKAKGPQAGQGFAGCDLIPVQHVVAVAADGQREIDKLRALQGYVCGGRRCCR